MNGAVIPRIAPRWKNAIAIYTTLPKPISDFESHEYFGVRPAQVPALFSSPVRHHPNRLGAWPPVTFQKKERHRIHKLLRCIDENIVIGQLKNYPVAGKYEYMIPPATLKKAYNTYPQIIENTEKILASSSFHMTEGPETTVSFSPILQKKTWRFSKNWLCVDVGADTKTIRKHSKGCKKNSK